MLQSALNFIFKKWVVNWAKYQSFWKELNSHCWGKEQGCCSVAKSCLTLWSHGLQHARHPCPSLSPEVCLKSCPLSWWCHLTISSSATLFSFCLQSFLTSGFFFPMSWFFASGGQSMGVSASASVLPMNIQVWFSLGLTSWISFLSKGLSRVFSSTRFESINSLVLSLLCGPTLTSVHDYWKNHGFDYMDLCLQSNASAF